MPTYVRKSYQRAKTFGVGELREVLRFESANLTSAEAYASRGAPFKDGVNFAVLCDVRETPIMPIVIL